MGIVKSIFITLQSLFFAMVIQTKDSILLLLFLFLANILVGILADIVFSHHKFEFKKFIRAAGELAIYIAIMCGISVTAHLKKEIEIGSFALNVLSWLFIYAYGVNIFKNLSKILPNSVVISYIYYVISFEIVKKIPFFKDFKEKQPSNF